MDNVELLITLCLLFLIGTLMYLLIGFYTTSKDEHAKDVDCRIFILGAVVTFLGSQLYVFMHVEDTFWVLISLLVGVFFGLVNGFGFYESNVRNKWQVMAGGNLSFNSVMLQTMASMIIDASVAFLPVV